MLRSSARTGECTIEIEHRGLPSGDTVTWLEVDEAVERVLGFCTVPAKGMAGGCQAIGKLVGVLFPIALESLLIERTDLAS